MRVSFLFLLSLPIGILHGDANTETAESDEETFESEIDCKIAYQEANVTAWCEALIAVGKEPNDKGVTPDLLMEQDAKLNNEEQIDGIISAEIPDAQTNPKLFDIVSRFMIHGPCGRLNPNASCMTNDKDGKHVCARAYPKDFNNDETCFNQSSYPTYRRRDPLHGGKTFTQTKNGKTITIDNSRVVPYNPYLLLYFNAHINVEVVQDIGAVKYLYKYVTKGSDKTVFSLAPENTDVDEIKLFETGRFISSSEAFWRIYGFSISFVKPCVMKLALHLENEQPVLFPDTELEETVEKGPPKTHLTEFFNLVQRDDTAKTLSYPDICRYFSWSNTGRKWIKRKVNVAFSQTGTDALSDMVGRVPIVNLTPKQSEIYFLRMLLYQRKGPSSFTDLRTVNGHICSTFEEACKKLGLIEHEDELDLAMNEIASVSFGKRIRRIFAALLAFRTPVDPQSFWDRHESVLCEDFKKDRSGQQINDTDRASALAEIQDLLDGHGLNLQRNFRIRVPTNAGNAFTDPTSTDYDIDTLKNLHNDNIQQLTDEQRAVYDKVIKSVKNDDGKCYLLDAPGGTGKTFLLTTILAYLRSEQKVAVATALSGLAALLLPKGKTLHSAMKVPIDIEEFSTCNVTPRDATAEIFRQCKLLVIDEFSMGHRHIFEAIDRTLRDIRKDNRLFGGLTTLFSGDWRQILPVVRRGGRHEIIDACFRSSRLYQQVEVQRLTQNLRLENPNDQTSMRFQEYLLKIGNGLIESDENGYIAIDPAREQYFRRAV